jgi:phosphoribosyl 1,2-cyclic phosphodiesterase
VDRIGFNMVASGSGGNCSLVWDQDNLIVIDFGISLRRLKNRMKELKIDITDISLFISHEHSDHSSGVRTLIRNSSVDVYTRQGTADSLGLNDAFAIRNPVVIGNFSITPIPVSHDAADPVAFVIHNGKAKVSVVSDLGFVSPDLVGAMMGSQVIALEANHDVDMLKSGSYPFPLKKRILSDHGHLSNTQTAEALESVSRPWTEIVLTHLSQENNLPDLARRTVGDHLSNRGIEYRSLECASQDLGSPVYDIAIF